MKNRERQLISEYVGEGHPDRVADKIAKIINDGAITSATEVMIRHNSALFLSGETTFESSKKKKETLEIVKDYLQNLCYDYGYLTYDLEIIERFVSQDKMLSERKKNLLAGDQEVVYYDKLKTNDVHYILREIDNKVSSITRTYDYKILVNLENNTANLSISTSHKKYKRIKILLLDEIYKNFPNITLNICEFAGGSIFNDTGVTGRKLIVEQSGCGLPHGGGAVFGKDETKTAPYAHKLAREYATKNNLDSVVVVYFPGDNLDNPNFIGENK